MQYCLFVTKAVAASISIERPKPWVITRASFAVRVVAQQTARMAQQQSTPSYWVIEENHRRWMDCTPYLLPSNCNLLQWS